MLTLDDVKRAPDGTFFVRPYLGTNAVTGRRIRPYRSFPAAATAGEALDAANEWFASLDVAAELKVDRRLGQLLSRYIDMRAASASPNTVRAYRTDLRCYVDPYIGGKDPDDVRPLTVEGLYNALMLSGARSGGGVAPATVAHVHWMLCGGWRWMVREGVCESNPMLSVRRPRAIGPEAASLAGAEFAGLVSALGVMLAEDPADARGILERNYAMAAYLALMEGLRCGEACALLLGDARCAPGSLHVGGTVVEAGGVRRRPATKGGRSRNVAMAPEVARAVEAHVRWQASYLPRALAPDPRRPLLCGPSGGLLRPSEASRWFSANRARLGVSGSATMHTLRHTHATMLLMDGWDMRTIQERLGHADVATTLRVYAHVVPGRDAGAAAAFARMAGGGADGDVR